MSVQSTGNQYIELKTMDNTMKDVLDTWLKFGTVFLIYQLGVHYFIDKNNREIFDARSMQLGLFVLIGFTLYFLLVKPFLSDLFAHPILKNITNDVLFYGSGLVVSNLLISTVDKKPIFEKEWATGSLYILFGFIVYRILTFRFVPQNLDDNIKLATNDVVQFGTMLVIVRLFQTRSLEGLTDTNWLLSLLFALSGFVAYDVVIRRLILVD
jgi:hypothetical protein